MDTEPWLSIPDRPRRIPLWRLCTIMALCFLILWIGAPVLFALAF